MSILGEATVCNLETRERPVLTVVVDTEEEFNWSKGFSRANTSVRSMREIFRVQRIFDEYGIKPVYVVDYPVAMQAEGYEPLQEIFRQGRCVIGAHLHPWVTPPFTEDVNRMNSFPGNLLEDVEMAKLSILTEALESRFSVRPSIYKAGRYGIGANTTRALERLGYTIDMSVSPCMDYSNEGGPDFSDLTAWPSWIGKERRILELPLTVGFSGALRRWGPAVFRMTTHPALRRFHLFGAMARLGVLDKNWLTPEGYTLADQVKLIRTLYQDGLRVFSLGFHSPSVEPGHTPYVNSFQDLEMFVSSLRGFFDFFFGELNGRAMTPLDLRKGLAASKSGLDEEFAC